MTIIYSSKPLREREKHDFYPTQIELCRASLTLLPEDFYPRSVLDPGCGTGVWGEAVYQKYDNPVEWKTEPPIIAGIDIRELPHNPLYGIWETGDYLKSTFKNMFHLVIGNPPYKFAEEFLDKSMESVADGGYILFLLRLAFLESKSRFDKYYSMSLNPWKVAVSTRRLSFTGDNKSDNTAYAIYIWKKGWTGTTELTWLDWIYSKKEKSLNTQYIGSDFNAFLKEEGILHEKEHEELERKNKK